MSHSGDAGMGRKEITKTGRIQNPMGAAVMTSRLEDGFRKVETPAFAD